MLVEDRSEHVRDVVRGLVKRGQLKFVDANRVSGPASSFLTRGICGCTANVIAEFSVQTLRSFSRRFWLLYPPTGVEAHIYTA